jgi:hypothetical protein
LQKARPAPTEEELIADPCAALIWGDEPAARTVHMRPLTDSMRRLPALVNALL